MARLTFATVYLSWLLLINNSAEAWTPKIVSSSRSKNIHATSPNCLKNPFYTTSTTNDRSSTTAAKNLLQLNAAATASSTELSDTAEKLVFFNSLKREKTKFETLIPGQVSMYTCGPTVYDSAHVGNFRAFLTYDVLKRALLYFGYSVTHVCNLTDVDDKIIKKCDETNTDAKTLTRKYEKAFMDDLDALNIIRANNYPRATEHINEMVEMIQMLEKNELAYQTPEGSWYFAVNKQEGYGKQLVNLQFDDMEATDRVSAEQEEKQYEFDFCLWKAYKPGIDRDDMTWDTPLGKGRPGWHLECSAMARKYLGDTIDVHCGGVDLTFPHHENEIAQSEGATGKPFCNCWIHNGFVNINDEKMSKSLGNFLTLRGACPKADDVRAYRYLVVSSQYRNPLSFTDQATSAAKSALKRMDKTKQAIDDALTKEEEPESTTSSGDSEIAAKLIPAQLANFEAALLDDLSMPRAAASLFACAKAAEAEFKRIKKAEKDGNEASPPLDVEGLRAVRDAMEQMDKIFGIFYTVPLTEEEKESGKTEEAEDLVVPDEVMELVGQRTAAKDSKEWDVADSLRARITELGFAVKDVKGGEPIVSRIEN